MKRILKRFMPQTILLVLVAVFAVAPVSVFAAVNGSTDNKVDLSLVMTPETQLTVYVDGALSGELSREYSFGDSVSITAPSVSGKVFSHWEADGSVISYSRTLQLTMNAHTTLYAVYAETAQTAQPVAGFTSITRTNDGGSISFQAIAAAKDGGAFTGSGIVYSTTTSGEGLIIGGADVTNVPADKLTDSTSTLPDSILDGNNCWMLKITPENTDTVYHARAYVTTDAGTTYGDVKNVKLSDLESGISMIANLDGFDPENSLNDLLASLAAEMHTVTFEPNGGVGATMTQAFLPGQSVTLKANTFTREGYAFKGWNTKADGSGTAYTDGQSVTFSNDTTLYAVWDQAVSYTVTFKVANGTWDDGSTADKTVTLEGYASDSLKLTAADIPAVGTKPGNGYKAGSWDVTPSTDAAITKDVTYTYSYVDKDSISRTVTFKVVNGAWDDGTTADKTVTLNGLEGDKLKLSENQIPAVGGKPNDNYKAGSWDVMPGTETEITKETTYTYTYVQADIGTIEIPAENEEGNFGAAGLENTAEELKASVLTDDDKTAIAAGKDVAVWLEMKDNSANVTETDKTLVTNTVTQSLGSGYEVGIYLDLTLWKQVEGAAKVPVTELNGKVKVTMTIPENLRKAGATYKIIRIHNGVATVIDTIVDETTWKLTFETDAFSTYALAYTTAASTTPTATTPTASEPGEESDYLEPLRSKLHAAGEAGGAQTVEYTGSFSLPIEFMTYLKEHPQVTLVYHTSYEGEEFTVTIPGNKAIVDEKIGWYGPLWLRAHYGTGTAAKGTVTAPKTDDTLHGYGFWFILMAIGIATGAAGFIRKKSGLKNQK